MSLTGGAAVRSAKVLVSCPMTFAEYDAESTDPNNYDIDRSGNRNGKVNVKEINCHMELTNGVTGTYQAIASITPGDAYVTGAGGIAKYLYLHMNSNDGVKVGSFQYDGDAVHVAAEFADSTADNYVDLGCAFNLSGGASEWETMNAQIQSISEDFGTHTTSVQIGVASNLNAGQLSSLLNMWRGRRAWYNPAIRTTGSGGLSTVVDTAISSGQSNGVDGVQGNHAMSFYDYVLGIQGELNGGVVIDASHIKNIHSL